MWIGSKFDGLTSLADTFIGDVEDELRGCLSQRYDVSIDAFQTSTATPPLLEMLCKWKAIGYLYGNVARGSKDMFNRSKWYTDRCDKKVEAILNYDANLVDTAGSQIADSTGKLAVKSSTEDYSNTIQEDDPLKWKIDPDKLNDIKSDRR